MPDPNRHDQPAEGGTETVEKALQKQSEPKPDAKPRRKAPDDKGKKQQ